MFVKLLILYYNITVKQVERTETAETIAVVLTDWLRAEVESSSEADDVNSYLNDYEAAMRGLRGGPEHPENWAQIKTRSHTLRLSADIPAFCEMAPDDPDFDIAGAKVGFDALMQVSGAYRNYCYVCARDGLDYMVRRRQAAGGSVPHAVRMRIEELVPLDSDLEGARISQEQLRRTADKVMNLGSAAIERLCEIMAVDEEETTPEQTILGRSHQTHEAAQLMIGAQANWLNLAIDSVLLIAKLRAGKLETVPFMLPTSIRNQPQPFQLKYPFRDKIDWAKVLAETPKP